MAGCDIIKVIIDSREPATIKKWLPTAFKSIPSLHFDIKPLHEGDYEISCENGKGPKVLVERKTISDLYSSIMHGHRLETQVSRLTTHQTDTVVILLITGSIDEYVAKMRRMRKIVNPEILNGAIASLVTRDNLRIIIEYNDRDALKHMIRIGVKICEGELDVPRLRNMDTLAARLLDIKLESWMQLKDKHGTDFTYIASLSEKKIAEIPGIGKVKAKKIKEILTGKSEDWMK